jgi:hypothetical protein
MLSDFDFDLPSLSDWDSGEDADMEDNKDGDKDKDKDKDKDDGSSLESSISADTTEEDDLMTDMEGEFDEDMEHTGLGTHVLCLHKELYKKRYREPRGRVPRAPPTLPTVFSEWKHSHLDLFRQHRRINPTTFDRLVTTLEHHPVLTNNSPNAQLSAEHQLAIALYRFGHNGNASSLQKVATWAGVGKGTVLKCTRRVITAILAPEFMERHSLSDRGGEVQGACVGQGALMQEVAEGSSSC